MNIEQHKFDDHDVSVREAFDDHIYLEVDIENNNYSYIDLHKYDVIELAKHFKLTADDIKDN